MAKFLVLSILAIMLVACKNETPPHWADICVKSHTIMMPYTIMIGNTPSIQFMYVDSCDQYEKQCLVGKDYKGPIKDCSNG